ncbi:hypothetical protein CTEN210_07991 [Chaetoceros tenuissimus]|uniref:Fe2OG dioxygenase domain-containing protein n=1 Tax=Chaetoceros tenuissimus TaxID=426638 RepID=A0AAD3H5V3_9STRA|nr:hypothetical protein CTEN210_07991 [Chaetoceros tenuissimus]
MEPVEKYYALEDAADRSMAAKFDGAVEENELRSQAQGWLQLSKGESTGEIDLDEASDIIQDSIPYEDTKVDIIKKEMSLDFPSTPCTRICRYNKSFFDGNICIGCFRDVHEISNWSSMAPIEKSYALEDAIDRIQDSEYFAGSVTSEDLRRQAQQWASISKVGYEEGLGKWQSIDIKNGNEESVVSSTFDYTSFIEGESILVLEDLISTEELTSIKVAADEIQARNSSERMSKGLKNEGLVRIPLIDAAQRASKLNTPFADTFPRDIDDKLNTILSKVLDRLDSDHERLIERLLSCHRLQNLFKNDMLQFSSREPAVNVYTKGGSFRPHEDGQQLTVLIYLSHPTEFDGGGTAFWPQDSRGHRVEDPSLIIAPNAGTVMIFRGDVTHSGLQINHGRRQVFVASFSPSKKG